MATGESKSKWNGNNEHLGLSVNSSEDQFDITLSYPGKRSTASILATEPGDVNTIWQGMQANSAHASNRLYYGDNLPLLALLQQDNCIRGKIKLVYIDPPFSTNSIFKSRTQSDAYHDLLVGAHYLEFMRERLVLIYDLLAQDGSLYLHIDDKMAFHIKVILDEIFGRTNFRNCITRRKCNPKNYTRKAYGNISDYIFFYTKSDQYTWNRSYEKWTTERAENEYAYIEPGTGRRYKKVPIHAPGVRNGETGKPWRGMYPPPGKHWQFPPKTLDEMDARGEIFWSANGNPRRKIYLDNSQGVPVQDIWWDFRDAHNQNIRITGYPTEKNPDLLTRIIEASSDPGDLVLDCFCGSGTTLAVASQRQRSWIGIDNSPEAIATTLRRFAKGPERMGDYVNKSSENGNLPVQLRLTNADEVISDFTLYAQKPYTGELDQSLVEWKNHP